MGDSSTVFGGCTFTFVPGKELTETAVSELSQLIVKSGGEVLDRKRDGTLPLAQITHIISNTIDFPEYTETKALLIPVVRTKWISASLAKGKQAQLRPYTPDPRMIFSDVVVTAADIPETDKETIIGAVTAMGGMDSVAVNKLTTHICALSLDHEKCQLALSKGLKCKIVLPHWFDDCFRLGKKIDEAPYLLPDPEILQAHPDKDVQVPSSQHLQGATSARPDYLPASADSITGARPVLTVFKDIKVMLSSDLAIRDRLRSIVHDLIQEGGGELTDDIETCDWFVCQYRDGPDYVRASHLGKTVGSLSWLYYIITMNEWTSPLLRLLHYPVPRDGIPGFKDKRITVSNYGGEARIYLENLITAAGAIFTKTMKADNTHLVTARDNSEKCDAARDWNINMINHLWIEESYARCEMQSVTNDRYTCFPARTNLGEVIGQTPLNEARVAALFYPGGPSNSAPISIRKRRIVELAEDNSYADGPAEGVSIGRQAHKDFDVMKDTDEDFAVKSTEVFGVPAKRRTSAQQISTPSRTRHVRSGKENETPSTVSSSVRSAKDKAISRLSEIAPDIALYEKEKKRSAKDGNGHWGGKRALDQVEKESNLKRNASSPSRAAEPDDELTSEKRPAKKARPTLPQVELRVVLTGFKRWVNDKHKEDADRVGSMQLSSVELERDLTNDFVQKKLRDMGIAVVPDGQAVDYLVAPQIVRTVKFLRNLSKGATVVSSEWIEDCLDSKKAVDPADYLLKDVESEKKFELKLTTSTERARKNAGKLLAGIPIYCTANIKNGTDSYKAIAEANGAIFMTYAARSGTTIRPTNPEDDVDGPEPVYLLSTAQAAETKLWKRFEEMARKGNMEPRVVASDWLLDVAMRQELFWDEKYLVTNFFNDKGW
ncbi:uncharacterized protein B0I36DRAFT_391200 [Microdochium trichocladiopsis]|uniref:BRCT domain-containing protein n=1 Tax=Microdochium trichocladiopsis TaxID=1682393 RepID=A0A9P9BW20_9PEZI|nr:uncharacterized protein B0I36DRAFT_391200 [Microdochium trichocladiopsis]KAH7040347.1 hypothetical protein B0I36DRAFT_391200 [Microdochium trichocladiopsis]